MFSAYVAVENKDGVHLPVTGMDRTWAETVGEFGRVLDQADGLLRAAGFEESDWAVSLGHGAEGHLRYPDATDQGRTGYIAWWRT